MPEPSSSANSSARDRTSRAAEKRICASTSSTASAHNMCSDECKSGSVTESISAAEVVGMSQFALGSSSFVCKVAGVVTCDMPEDTYWVSRLAFDPYEETPSLRLCLSALEQLAFKIPEKGFKVGMMMMSFICSCRNKKEEPSSIYTLRKVRTIRGQHAG